MLCCNVEADGVKRLSTRGVIDMQWVRSNIRLGGRLAIFALTVQLLLSFGHVHAIASPTTPSIQSSQQLPAPSPDSDQHPDDFCAICAVMALASTAVAATPPALPQPPAFEHAQPTTLALFTSPRPTHAAFRSRAPPIT
jgi:hypothetical protein